MKTRDPSMLNEQPFVIFDRKIVGSINSLFNGDAFLDQTILHHILTGRNDIATQELLLLVTIIHDVELRSRIAHIIIGDCAGQSPAVAAAEEAIRVALNQYIAMDHPSWAKVSKDGSWDDEGAWEDIGEDFNTAVDRLVKLQQSTPAHPQYFFPDSYGHYDHAGNFLPVETVVRQIKDFMQEQWCGDLLQELARPYSHENGERPLKQHIQGNLGFEAWNMLNSLAYQVIDQPVDDELVRALLSAMASNFHDLTWGKLLELAIMTSEYNLNWASAAMDWKDGSNE